MNVANGYISMTDNEMVSANVIADMTTIACTDLEGEWGDKLVGHLVSEDFFHVDEYATSSLRFATSPHCQPQMVRPLIMLLGTSRFEVSPKA